MHRCCRGQCVGRVGEMLMLLLLAGCLGVVGFNAHTCVVTKSSIRLIEFAD